VKHARSDYARIQDPWRLIPNDEPVFLIRGQDVVAPEVLRFWAKTAEQAGAKPDIVELVLKQAEAMEVWQGMVSMKVPDLPEKQPLPILHERYSHFAGENGPGLTDAWAHARLIGQVKPHEKFGWPTPVSAIRCEILDRDRDDKVVAVGYSFRCLNVNNDPVEPVNYRRGRNIAKGRAFAAYAKRPVASRAAGEK